MGPGSGDVANATVRRWQLTETLRHLRERTGLTIEQAAEQLNAQHGKWSRAKLGRIENRAQGVKPREVEQILDLYEIAEGDLRMWVLSLAVTACERGYWRAIRRDLPEDFHEFLSVEAALVAYRQFETMLIPGLLQTADYTRAVVNGAYPGLPGEVVERRVLARQSRQQVLTRTKPLRLHVILDEAILERPVGGAAVMRTQLQRLVDESRKDHITVQLLPRNTGASPALEGPFSILTLPDPIPDFGYAEGPGGAVYVEDRETVRTYTFRWGILTEQALSEPASTELIAKVAQSYHRLT